MSYFVYRSLTPNLKRIRLIHLQPKSVRASAADEGLSEALPVACTISHVSLDQPPPYIALSYTWGDTSQKGRILFGGVPFIVTKSLEVALTHLIPDDVHLTLWIDALCIDQDDEVEKTEQVQQMRQIYTQAARVITWLGPATASSHAAMLWVQRYGSLAHSFGVGSRPELQLRKLLQACERDPEQLPPLEGLEAFLRDIRAQLSGRSDSVIVALSELFARAYWSRVWVVQEVVHGKRVEFVCGHQTVSEDQVHHALRVLRNFGRHELIKSAQSLQATDSQIASAVAHVRNPINVLKIRRSAGPFPLIYLIRTLRFFQATDPRDRIFALLGFATDAAALGLRPDYQKPCWEVYLETTTALVRNGFLDIFAFCRFAESVPELPSWVPDFTRISKRAPLQQRALDRKAVPSLTALQPGFKASGNAPFITREPPDLTQPSPRTLPLLVRCVDRVRNVGCVFDPENIGLWLSDLFDFSMQLGNTLEPSDVWRVAVADQEIRQGVDKPRLSRHELDKVHNSIQGVSWAAADEQTFVSLGLGDYIYQMQDVAYGRRPFCTASGRLGIGPSEMEVSDGIYLLQEAQVPYILREDSGKRARMVGEAYVNGIMDGEAAGDGLPIVVHLI